MKLEDAYILAEETIYEGKLEINSLSNFINNQIDKGFTATEIAKKIINLGEKDAIHFSNVGIHLSVVGHQKANTLKDEICVNIQDRTKFITVKLIFKEIERLLREEEKKLFPKAPQEIKGATLY